MGRGSKTKGAGLEQIHSTRLHLILYSLLLILTPFILLRNFLVEAIARVSDSTLPLATLRVPIIPLAAALLLILLVVRFRVFITRRVLTAVVIVAAMDALAQQITDFYFGHKFYDLQQNWHYVAYGLFAYMVYRDLAWRRLSQVRILWLTFLSAMALSSFDEAFQMHLSSRVFDLSDIAKDGWGCLMGMVLITLGGGRSDELLRGWGKIRTTRIGDHFRNPLTALVFIVVFDLIFLSCGSLLSDFRYVGAAVGLTLLAFALFLVIDFLLLRRWARIGLAILLFLLSTAVGYEFFRHRDERVVQNQHCITVYKGIPIPFFDVLIYPNGRFRLVDKKRYFNSRDRRFFLRQRTDIIVIGSGEEGLGGKGFPETSMVQFLYNPFLGRATQVIILTTPDACRLFNRLMRDQKNVLLVLHNTC